MPGSSDVLRAIRPISLALHAAGPNAVVERAIDTVADATRSCTAVGDAGPSPAQAERNNDPCERDEVQERRRSGSDERPCESGSHEGTWPRETRRWMQLKSDFPRQWRATHVFSDTKASARYVVAVPRSHTVAIGHSRRDAVRTPHSPHRT